MPEPVAKETGSGEATALVVGLSQRSSALGVRDRLYVEDQGVASFLEDLRGAGLRQAMLVSTCDRVEVHAMAGEPLAASRSVISVLERRGGFAAGEIADQLYVLTGRAAVRHLFAVCASLESTIVGEPHVLGQLKASYQAARASDLSGSDLDALVQRAFAVAKRIRSETAIGEAPVSVAAAAIDLVRGVHGDLGSLSALMIGTGEMGELLAESMRAAGLLRLAITDTRPARAEARARVFGCHARPLAELAEALAAADIIIAALGSRTPVVTAAMARSALRQRRNRPMVFLDAGLPGDIDPLADRLDGVFLYTLDDLDRVARDGRAARQGAVEAAWRMVDDAVAAFLAERSERAAVPVLGRLRGHFEAVRRQALADAHGDAEKATHLLINRLLHGPSRRLREIAGGGDGELARLEAMLARLFEATDNDSERKR